MRSIAENVFSNAPWARFLYKKRMAMVQGFWNDKYTADFTDRVQGFKLTSSELSQIRRNIV